MDYLFVYGTLRKGYNLKLKAQVAGQMQYIGKAKVNAALYDLGRYPGAVKEKTTSEVIGDVFLLTDPQKTLAFLDRYEGEEYDRRRTRVKLKSGKWINGWMYWYNGQQEATQRIRYKDYFNYLKNKSLLLINGALHNEPHT